MKNSVFTGILALIGVISAASSGAIILFIPASSAGVLAKTLLTLGVALFLVSIGTLLGLYIRRGHITKKNRASVQTIALREAALLGALLVAYMWIAHNGALNVWIVAASLLAIMGLEYFFLTHAHN